MICSSSMARPEPAKGTLEIAMVANLVVQPTGASLDDLRPAVREFHALIKAGVPKDKLILRSIISVPKQRRPRHESTLSKGGTSFYLVTCPSVPVTERLRTWGTPSLKLGFLASTRKPMLVQTLMTESLTMADASKLKRKNSLGVPPSVDEASRNLHEPEIPPVAPIASATSPPQYIRAVDGRSRRRTNRIMQLNLKVTPEFDAPLARDCG